MDENLEKLIKSLDYDGVAIFPTFFEIAYSIAKMGRDNWKCRQWGDIAPPWANEKTTEYSKYIPGLGIVRSLRSTFHRYNEGRQPSYLLESEEFEKSKYLYTLEESNLACEIYHYIKGTKRPKEISLFR